MLQMLFSNPLIFITVALILMFSLSVHEFAHAFVADKLGDPTARYLGRITLNPLAHLDPLGTLALLFLGFGWGRPVPFNPMNLSHPRRDAALISFAGPLSNLTLALVFAFLSRIVFPYSLLSSIFTVVVTYNLVLAFFNLIPLHPLDGFKVVAGLLPFDLAVRWMEIEQYGMYLLLFMVITGSTSKLIFPLVDVALSILGVK